MWFSRCLSRREHCEWDGTQLLARIVETASTKWGIMCRWHDILSTRRINWLWRSISLSMMFLRQQKLWNRNFPEQVQRIHTVARRIRHPTWIPALIRLHPPQLNSLLLYHSGVIPVQDRSLVSHSMIEFEYMTECRDPLCSRFSSGVIIQT
jgi:hypothetical protein